MQLPTTKIAVLLSGGVDSSVALRLLKEAGHDVTAFYLKIWLQDEFSFLGDCPWEEDLEFASAVCKESNVPLEVLPLQHEYWEHVVSYTITEIKAGRTPNPDMFCNRLIKFGQFFNKIDDSFEKVASGHYGRVTHNSGRYQLRVSPDVIKDQTYFLAYLTQQQLGRALFPIGELTKKEVRTAAERFGLATKQRKDSQGICFLGRIKFRDFVKQHLGELPGDIIHYDTGKRMGRHQGYYYYTIGQRSGIGLHGGPWYVVGKDIPGNIIYISGSTEALQRERNSFAAGGFNWISGEPAPDGEYRIKIRHGARYFTGQLTHMADGTAQVTLHGTDRGIAPGQFAVFYRGDECLGGGTIL